MKRGRITAAAVAVLLALAYTLNGNEDAELWAWLFWISAIANVVLFMLLLDARESAGRGVQPEKPPRTT